jgi:hypothetical protein
MITDVLRPAGGAVCDRSVGSDLRYHLVQLCPPATGEWTSFRVLDDRASTGIADRINALSAAPPSPTCAAGAPQAPVDLVLRAGGTAIVVRLDTGQCGSAQRGGVVRYGAGDLYRFTTGQLES